MISDELKDQAALYALGTLNAEETAEFERAMSHDDELRNMVRSMRDASADLVHTIPSRPLPQELKNRILREIALEQQGSGSVTPVLTRTSWMPWAIAALFLAFCGILLLDRVRLQRELASARTADSLAQATFVTLSSPNGEHPDAKAMVAWQPDRQSGVIMINNMPPAGEDRDYQLWAVDAGHKDPISAGVIHVEPGGVTRVHFKPQENATQIKAFAISLERKGGVPKREGPIVMVGNA